MRLPVPFPVPFPLPFPALRRLLQSGLPAQALALGLALAPGLLVGCAGGDKPADRGAEGALGGTDQDADGDGFSDDDCDDGDAATHPGALEACDGRDNNCDGAIDEGVLNAYFLDEDGDGFGGAATVEACAAPAGATPTSTDCDDGDGAIFPGAAEGCDGQDNDCDGLIDEDGGSTYYADADEDGHGDPDAVVMGCDAAPAGAVALGDDCDDADAGVNPEAAEVCDERDNDCDGDIDEGVASTYYQDADRDGFGIEGLAVEACALPAGYADQAGDCDDSRATVSPDAAERCDGTDNDCDGDIDEEGATGGATYYTDADGDRYGDPAAPRLACSPPADAVSNALDCDDGDAAVSPAGTERCDGQDNDCDGTADEPEAVDARLWASDMDGDGYAGDGPTLRGCTAPAGSASVGGDCDDGDAAIRPGAAEVCDGQDNDCDGGIDLWAIDAIRVYADTDGDGFGDPLAGRDACSPGAGEVRGAADCDDTRADVNPDADERCNGRDDDCDGLTDDPSAIDARRYYADTDGDGFGDPAALTLACSAPAGSVADDTDCAPAVSTAFPGSTAVETPFDGIDTDCDGLDACADLDCDGVPDLLVPEYYDGNYATTSYLYYGDGGYADADRRAFTTSGTYKALADDLDEDGYQDVIFVNYVNDSSTYALSLDLYWGSSAGHSAALRTSLPTLGATDALVADLDADGFKDIAVANYYSGSTRVQNSYVYWGSASGFNAATRDDLPTIGALRVKAADLNNDGYQDLVYCNHYTDTTYSTNSYVYWGSARGYSAADRTSLPTVGCYEVELADLDDNGFDDIIFANYTNGTSYTISSYIYWGSATGYSVAAREALTTYGATDVEVGDADGDGHLDLLFSSYYNGAWTSAAYTMLYWGSSFGFTPSNYTAFEVRGTWGVKMSDLDGDGYQELLLGRHYNGTSYIANNVVLWGSPTGYTWADRTELAAAGNAHMVAGDLDDDGIPELLLANYHTGSWATPARSSIYWGQAGASYSAAAKTTLNTHGTWRELVVVGDARW